MPKQISIAWGFFGFAILCYSIGNTLKYKQEINEITYNCVETIEGLSEYIQKRFDDLTDEEIMTLTNLSYHIRNIKRKLPHYKHMY